MTDAPSATRATGPQHSTAPRSSRAPLLVLGVAVVAVLVSSGASLVVGARAIPFGDVVDALFSAERGTGSTADVVAIVRDYRVPRLVLGLLVGAALAVAGALAQNLTRNPLAEPGLLGVTAGAALGVMVGTAVWSIDSQVAILTTALIGAVLATAVVFAVGGNDPLRLVLAGTALSAVGAGVGLGLRLVLPDVFDAYRFWSVGSLAGRESLPLLVPGLAIFTGLVLAAALVPSLQAMTLGEDVATGLGVHVTRTRVLALATITVLAAAATAAAGPIVFVGLIVPHLVRRACGGSIGWLLGLSALLGPALVVSADTVARVLLQTGEVPVGVVTAAIGGPALIWVVRRYGQVVL